MPYHALHICVSDYLFVYGQYVFWAERDLPGTRLASDPARNRKVRHPMTRLNFNSRPHGRRTNATSLPGLSQAQRTSCWTITPKWPRSEEWKWRLMPSTRTSSFVGFVTCVLVKKLCLWALKPPWQKTTPSSQRIDAMDLLGPEAFQCILFLPNYWVSDLILAIFFSASMTMAMRMKRLDFLCYCDWFICIWPRSLCMRMRMRICVCMCVCVCLWLNDRQSDRLLQRKRRLHALVWTQFLWWKWHCWRTGKCRISYISWTCILSLLFHLCLHMHMHVHVPCRCLWAQA